MARDDDIIEPSETEKLMAERNGPKALTAMYEKYNKNNYESIWSKNLDLVRKAAPEEMQAFYQALAKTAEHLKANLQPDSGVSGLKPDIETEDKMAKLQTEIKGSIDLFDIDKNTPHKKYEELRTKTFKFLTEKEKKEEAGRPLAMIYNKIAKIQNILSEDNDFLFDKGEPFETLLSTSLALHRALMKKFEASAEVQAGNKMPEDRSSLYGSSTPGLSDDGSFRTGSSGSPKSPEEEPPKSPGTSPPNNINFTRPGSR